MQYLSGKAILDRAFTRISDNSDDMRIRMLAWLNSAMQDAANERPWTFLEKYSALTLVNSAAILPSDFGQETFMEMGTTAFTTGDKLTPELAFQADEAGGNPYGYTIKIYYNTGHTPPPPSQILTIHPAATGTVTLYYTAAFTSVADDVATTLFPINFMPLFERYLLTAFNEYDVDEVRFPISVQLDQDQLKKLKKWDNMRKPLPQLESKGFVRA